jgi:hypothetical protein
MKKLNLVLRGGGGIIFCLRLALLKESSLKRKKSDLFHRYHWYYALSIFLASMFTFVQSSAQSSNINGIIIQGTEIDIPSSEGGFSQNAALNELLNAFGVTSYSIAYPVAKTKKAKNCFEIILGNATDSDYERLALELKGMSYEEVLIENETRQLTQCDPVPYDDPCVQGNGGHYITNSNLPCAWDITHGSSDIIVALIDQYMDDSHDDLKDKVVSIWYKDPPNPQCSLANHGYSMAGAIAGIVNNG